MARGLRFIVQMAPEGASPTCGKPSPMTERRLRERYNSVICSSWFCARGKGYSEAKTESHYWRVAVLLVAANYKPLA